MTTPDPKAEAYRLAEVADLKMQVRALEAELAQSQAEVERANGLSAEMYRKERALADELAKALTSPKSSGGEALIRYYRARSGAQGEDS